MHAEIARDMRDRPAGLKHQPDTAFSKLWGVLAWRGHRGSVSSPQDRSSWLRSLHRTRDGSFIFSIETTVTSAI
jgi:hypothetical protein